MIRTLCQCGAECCAPESEANQSKSCPACGRTIRLVCSEHLPPGAGAADFDARLIRRNAADDTHQTQYYLGGVNQIEIGRQAESHIMLVASQVCRRHCTLNRIDFGPSRWSITDHHSVSGVYVNGHRVEEAELHHGDIVRIGDFELVYELSGAARPAKTARAAAANPSVPLPARPAAVAAMGGTRCPSCGTTLAQGARICVDCGINVITGRPILMSKGVDEDALKAHAEQIIRWISWIVPLTPLPIPLASEGFGTKKPYAIWGITAFTVLASLAFFLATWGGGDSSLNSLMLWPPGSGFRWYQLLTHAFLHDNGSILGFALHLGGNMLFLLVFGTRVNAVLGNVMTLILYPLLAIAAAAFDLYMTTSIFPVPMLGASGAIMGLAGIYLVLFPLHRVFCAMWMRWGLFMGFRISLVIFPVRGFWVLLMYFAYDLIMGLLTRNPFGGGTAHWAHLGGFSTGVVIALLILFSRRINTYGGDLLSVALGRRAWRLIGKPTQWQGKSAKLAGL